MFNYSLRTQFLNVIQGLLLVPRVEYNIDWLLEQNFLIFSMIFWPPVIYLYVSFRFSSEPLATLSKSMRRAVLCL